jgi:hypothetical protein
MHDHELTPARKSRNTTNHTTDARAAAQRAKLDAQKGTHSQETVNGQPF